MSYPPSRYILRFDDICPTMNWEVWGRIESLLYEHNIKPIIAVIPDNQDPKLMDDPARENFWDKVRQWQADGWAVGLHGYRHQYVNQSRGMMRLTPSSEFAELPREEQKEKLSKGLAIFREQNVNPDCWVAPSHSFDRTTVSLLRELGLAVISDGYWPMPYVDENGMTWIPQQLWGLVDRPTGFWTACYHHSGWKPDQEERFKRDVEAFSDRISSMNVAKELATNRSLDFADRVDATKRFVYEQRFRPLVDRIRGRKY